MPGILSSFGIGEADEVYGVENHDGAISSTIYKGKETDEGGFGGYDYYG